MKIIIPIILALILIFPVLSAAEINMNSEVSKGETVIAPILGNFLNPITKENVYFYRGHVKTYFDYDVAKIGDQYYVYFETLSKLENNYSINITGVKHIEGTQTSDEQFSKSFKIINETADFSISPGFIISSEEFFIELKNLQYSSLNIDLESKVSSGNSEGDFKLIFNGVEVTNDLVLSPSITRNLYVKVDDLSGTTVRMLTLKSGNTEYNIPFYLILGNIPEVVEPTEEIPSEEEEEENITIEQNCSFFQVVFGTCDTNKTLNETVKNETIKNETLEEEKEEEQKEYEVVKQGNKTVVIKDGKVLNETATLKTCAQIRGKVCSSGEVCTNQTVYAKDSQCCVSECVKKEAKANTKVLGWAIIVLIIIMILWFFLKKFRGTTTKKDTLLGSRR